MGEKVGFTNGRFGKLRFAENIIFYCLFSKTQQLQQNFVCRTKQKFMKNSGLFLNMAKRCFCLGVLLHVWFLWWLVVGVCLF